MNNWYYSNNGQQAGPIPEDQLRSLLETGVLTPATLVWREGMSNWQPASVALDGNAAEASTPPPVSRPAPSYGNQTGAPVATHLVPAILATLFCCLPFGIPAIVFAAQANSANAAGDYAKAADCAKKAAMWGWISFGVGILQIIAGLACGVFSAMMP